jgi:hypothetical protein
MRYQKDDRLLGGVGSKLSASNLDVAEVCFRGSLALLSGGAAVSLPIAALRPSEHPGGANYARSLTSHRRTA